MKRILPNAGRIMFVQVGGEEEEDDPAGWVVIGKISHAGQQEESILRGRKSELTWRELLTS
jgi:hypothetical protein